MVENYDRRVSGDRLCDRIEVMADTHPDSGARLLYATILEEGFWQRLRPFLEKRVSTGISLEHAGMLILPVIQYAAICAASVKNRRGLIVPPFQQFTKDDWWLALGNFLDNREYHESFDWNIATQVPERYVFIQRLLAYWFRNSEGKPITICDLGSSWPPIGISLLNTEEMRALFANNINCLPAKYQPINAELHRIAVDIQTVDSYYDLAWPMACLWPGSEVYRKQLSEAYNQNLLEAVDFKKGDAVEVLKKMPDSSVDAVINSLMIYQCNLTDLFRGFYYDEVIRVLKPGGLYVETKMKLDSSACVAEIYSAKKRITKSLLDSLSRTGVFWTKDENVRGELLMADSLLLKELYGEKRLSLLEEDDSFLPFGSEAVFINSVLDL